MSAIQSYNPTKSKNLYILYIYVDNEYQERET